MEIGENQENIEHKFDLVNRMPFRERCEKKCCGFAMWTKYVDP
jgi:hypothetical protein